jgi:hypothetical protein
MNRLRAWTEMVQEKGGLTIFGGLIVDATFNDGDFDIWIWGYVLLNVLGCCLCGEKEESGAQRRHHQLFMMSIGLRTDCFMFWNSWPVLLVGLKLFRIGNK